MANDAINLKPVETHKESTGLQKVGYDEVVHEQEALIVDGPFAGQQPMRDQCKDREGGED